MDLTFISLLQTEYDGSHLKEQLVNAGLQYAFALPAAIERRCSIGANHAQNRQLTSPDPTTCVAIARFEMIRAHFNKRAASASLRAESSFGYLGRPALRISTNLLRFLRSNPAWFNGELSMKMSSLWMIAAVSLIVPVSVADARSTYDGSWDLAFVTQSGACDPGYNFTINISNGILTHPNLVKFKGYVAKSGSVHASVTVHEKFASGTGRLSGTTGRGKWIGHTGSARCSGYWTAQRN